MRYLYTSCLLGVALFAGSASATVIESSGAGSAVLAVDATADFESTAALGSTYSENGLNFERVGLSTNNNGCGFGGCATSWPSFSGNYLYGVGFGGYIEISSATTLGAIEFAVDTGFQGADFYYAWEALLDGVVVSTGSDLVVSSSGAVLGFSSLTGFDSLRFTVANQAISGIGDSSIQTAPAIDTVRAQLLVAQVPEPGTLALAGIGLVAFGLRRRLGHRAHT